MAEVIKTESRGEEGAREHDREGSGRRQQGGDCGSWTGGVSEAPTAGGFCYYLHTYNAEYILVIRGKFI